MGSSGVKARIGFQKWSSERTRKKAIVHMTQPITVSRIRQDRGCSKSRQSCEAPYARAKNQTVEPSPAPTVKMSRWLGGKWVPTVPTRTTVSSQTCGFRRLRASAVRIVSLSRVEFSDPLRTLTEETVSAERNDRRP